MSAARGSLRPAQVRLLELSRALPSAAGPGAPLGGISLSSCLCPAEVGHRLRKVFRSSSFAQRAVVLPCTHT